MRRLVAAAAAAGGWRRPGVRLPWRVRFSGGNRCRRFLAGSVRFSFTFVRACLGELRFGAFSLARAALLRFPVAGVVSARGSAGGGWRCGVGWVVVARLLVGGRPVVVMGAASWWRTPGM